MSGHIPSFVKKISEEETSILNRFIDVLNKTCESEYVYSTEDHRRELQKHKYTLRRALVEFKQLIKENATSNYWLWRLDMELKYNFLQLVPFLKKRLDVMHDDFVSAVHSADRTMKDYSEQNLESFKEKYVVPDVAMLKSHKLEDIVRLIFREWAYWGAKDGEVIVCPSNSALSVISSKGTEEYGETGMILNSWMMEKLFPLMSRKLDEDDHGISVAENITVHIETDQQETEELYIVYVGVCIP